LRHPRASSDERHLDLGLLHGREGAGLIREVPGRLVLRLADHYGRTTTSGPFLDLSRQLLIGLDPPSHTRIRSLASHAFSPRMVERARPRIEALAHHVLDEVAADGGTDLLATYCYVLPVVVICELLGVPPDDHRAFRAWVPDFIAGLDVAAATSRRVRRRADDAAVALTRYFHDLIRRRRVDPDDRLLSALIASSDGDDRLDQDELVALTALLLIAGHETTANLMGNGLIHLWNHADQFSRWRSEPDLRSAGVEELLRYDSPIQLVQRIPLEPIEIGDSRLPAGRCVLLLLGAANRDPRRFRSPDRLDLARREGAAMSFGFGVHHCMGAALARAETEIGLGVLFDRYPRLRVTVERPQWKPTLIFRGLRQLPVRWD
jgi:cytochrome P450